MFGSCFIQKIKISVMKAQIRFLKEEKCKYLNPYIVLKIKPSVGEYSFYSGINNFLNIFEVDFLCCDLCDYTVLRQVDEGVFVRDGETVDIIFCCEKENEGSDSCDKTCRGFYIAEKENRGRK